VKGAPEKICELCTDNVPNDYLQVMENRTKEGYRVIALATKTLDYKDGNDVENALREEIESGLTFLGFLVLENRLKPESKGVMDVFKACDVTAIMATGDNILTAVKVARNCGIIDESVEVWSTDVDEKGLYWKSYLTNQVEYKMPWTIASNVEVAVTGKAFRHIVDNKLAEPYIFMSMIKKAKIYARMGPEMKAELVIHTQEILQQKVAMCGDGANDCSALKAADVGLSLSDSEASIAAPFTSKVQNISAMVTLLKEGRASLATAVTAFKFIMMYALVQFFCICCMIPSGSNMTDVQYLYVDLLCLFPLCIFQAYTASSAKLGKQIPAYSLFSFPVLLSMCVMAAVHLAFLIFF
jgi:cation-transporting P-type ATPase 13A2